MEFNGDKKPLATRWESALKLRVTPIPKLLSASKADECRDLVACAQWEAEHRSAALSRVGIGGAADHLEERGNLVGQYESAKEAFVGFIENLSVVVEEVKPVVDPLISTISTMHPVLLLTCQICTLGLRALTRIARLQEQTNVLMRLQANLSKFLADMLQDMIACQEGLDEQTREWPLKMFSEVFNPTEVEIEKLDILCLSKGKLVDEEGLTAVINTVQGLRNKRLLVKGITETKKVDQNVRGMWAEQRSFQNKVLGENGLLLTGSPTLVIRRDPIPSLPKYYIECTSKSTSRAEPRIIEKLCSASKGNERVSFALFRIGGTGKTTSAAGIMHNEDVVKCFGDRRLWVQLGCSSKEADVERAVLAIAWLLLGDQQARSLQQSHGGQEGGGFSGSVPSDVPGWKGRARSAQARHRD